MDCSDCDSKLGCYSSTRDLQKYYLKKQESLACKKANDQMDVSVGWLLVAFELEEGCSNQ